MLERFNRWFCSSAGVWQTFGFVVLIVVFERLYPNADPNGFELLYWLTVYSAVTQPILAYAAKKSSYGSDQILMRLREMCSDEFIVDRETHRLVKEIYDTIRTRP